MQACRGINGIFLNLDTLSAIRASRPTEQILIAYLSKHCITSIGVLKPLIHFLIYSTKSLYIFSSL